MAPPTRTRHHRSPRTGLSAGVRPQRPAARTRAAASRPWPCRCCRVRTGRAPSCSAPAPPSSPTSSGSTCSPCSSTTRPPARPARSRRYPVPLGGAESGPALGAAGRRRRRSGRPTSAGPARRSPGRRRDRSSVATSIPAVAADGGLEAFVVGLMLGSFGFHFRSQPPGAQPVGRVVLAGLPDAPTGGRGARPGGRGRRRRLAGPVAGHGARPTSRTPPGWPTRPGARRRGRAQVQGLGREAARRPTASAASSASGQASATPPRLIRLDYTPATAARRKARGWCWSARASPSTPAGSPSSPARRWST